MGLKAKAKSFVNDRYYYDYLDEYMSDKMSQQAKAKLFQLMAKHINNYSNHVLLKFLSMTIKLYYQKKAKLVQPMEGESEKGGIVSQVWQEDLWSF